MHLMQNRSYAKRNNARRMNQRYSGSPYGMSRGEYTAELRYYEPKPAQKQVNYVSPT